MRFDSRRNACAALALFVILGLPAAASAVSAIDCHCFQDRAYDPGRPAAADAYLLATTQNSLFAELFAVEKKSIVYKKQKGASGDDLWVAYWLASRSGRDPDSLLGERRTKGSWRKAAEPLAVPESSLGSRVAAALQDDAPDERMGQAVVDEVMLRCRFHGEAELATLRKAGAGNREVILAGLLAPRLRRPAAQLYRDVAFGKSSWGGLLARAGVEPSAIGSVVAMMIRSASAAGR